MYAAGIQDEVNGAVDGTSAQRILGDGPNNRVLGPVGRNHAEREVIVKNDRVYHGRRPLSDDVDFPVQLPATEHPVSLVRSSLL